MDYYSITTNACDAALAQYPISGTQTVFAQIAVGDGNGASYDPTKDQTALRNEVWRGDATVTAAADDPTKVIVTASIPAETGDFMIREAGIFAADGTLLVISKMPLSEKTIPESGSGSDFVVRIYVQVGDADAVTITVDPSQINASKKDVADAKAEVEEEIPTELPANGGTAADTTSINSALTLSTDAPADALAVGKLWGVYDA